MGDTAYSSDKPIQDKNEDSFNRAAFAKRLASTMLEKELGDGYVIGLYSPWGYGKTSTLNMIQQELELDENVVLVKFNPWLFTDQNAMIAGLFDTLAEALDKKLKNNKEKVGDLLKKYSGIFSPVPQVDVTGAGKALGSILSDVSLEELKQRVEEVITESKKRLIVIIDDVDRLDKDELFQLFKLIKIAVDFKNVVYVIAFDDKVVSDALGGRFLNSAESGQSFIEKIVQIPLHLPMISQRALDDYVLSGIDEVLAGSKIDIDQDEVNRFRLIFDEHVAGELKTPRMANRYLNSLKFVLPLVGEEINAVDLLIIEAVRMLYPEEYKQLRLMKNSLSGIGKSVFMDSKEAEKLLKAEVEKVTDSKPNLLGIVTRLFPAADNAMREYGGSYIDKKEIKRLRRAASPDYFDRYFTYGIPMEDVSDAAILEIMQLQNPEEAIKQLTELIKEKTPEAVVKKLRGYEDEVQQGDTLVRTLVGVAELVPEPPITGLNDTALEELVKMTLVIVGKLPAAEKMKLSKWAIETTQSSDFLAYFMRWVSVMSDPKKQDRIFSDEEKAELNGAAAKRISEKTKETPLYKDGSRIGFYNYHTWGEVEGNDKVKKRLGEEIQTFDDVCDFLTKYASVWYGSGSPKRGEIKADSYRYMCNVVEAEHLYKIIEDSKPEIAAIDEFKEFENKVNFVGNESTPAFRETIAKQFAYTYKKTKETPTEQPTEDEE